MIRLWPVEKFNEFVEWKRNKEGKDFDESDLPVTISHMTKLDKSIKFIGIENFKEFYLFDANGYLIQHITWITC